MFGRRGGPVVSVLVSVSKARDTFLNSLLLLLFLLLRRRRRRHQRRRRHRRRRRHLRILLLLLLRYCGILVNTLTSW